MAEEPKTTNGSSTAKSRTTIESITARWIAFILIGVYGAALIVVGVIAAVRPSPDNQAWVELFKSGLLILGGGLTTVLGYYFGRQGVQEAQTSADEARREKEKEITRRQEAEAERLPTFDQISLTLPEEMPPDSTEPDESPDSG